MATQSCFEDEQKQLQEAPESQRSVPLPPSSPRARSNSRGRQAPGASPGSRASQPGPDLRSQALLSAPGPARRSRATLRGPAVRRSLSAPDPAPSRHAATRPGLDVSNQASGSGAALQSYGSIPGPARRRRRRRRHSRHRRQAPRSSSALQCSAFEPGSPTHSCASGPSPALQPLSSLGSPASSSSSISSSSSSSTEGFVSKRLRSWRRSSPGSCSSLSGHADQSSSSSPDAETPSPPSQQRWHAVRMRASSPSPPGRLLPCPGQFGESSSSSSRNSPSSSSSSSIFFTSP